MLESALIYVAQNDSYIHSNEDLMKGTGVNDLASINFEAGKTYKIRVINMSALASKYTFRPMSAVLMAQCSLFTWTNTTYSSSKPMELK
jgi:hypothetical protein